MRAVTVCERRLEIHNIDSLRRRGEDTFTLMKPSRAAKNRASEHRVGHSKIASEIPKS